jgi:DNA-binding PadR family transcriptional regulator
MRYPLLALLAGGPAHGYELKQRFESQFGGVWPPVNIGQVYTTLQRLERDGLVHGREVDQSSRPARHVFEITEAGYRALSDWLEEPGPPPRVRDELFLKLVLSRAAGVADPITLIERQRQSLLQELRDLNQVATQQGENAIALLLIDGTVLHLEADLKWLDMCEERLRNGS